MTVQRLAVVVIDDSPVPRFAARAMLDATTSFRCAAEASGGVEGVRVCDRVRPDVVLLDVDMPGMDGEETAKAILNLGQPTPVIVAWTVSDTSDDLVRMIRAGCAGYALKDFGPAELERSLLAALQGEMPLPRRMLPDLVSRAVTSRRSEPDNAEELTPRERQVLGLLSGGAAAKEVASDLNISRRSVDAHVRSIYRKLDATNRVQALNRARSLGLLPRE